MKGIYRRITSGNRFSLLWVSTISISLLLSSVFFVAATNTVAAAQEGDYIYTVSGGPAVATITGYTGAGGAIMIPSTLGGYAVAAIGDSAFFYCTSLTSVTIPNSLKSIGYFAFYYCTALTSVTIPNSVTRIGYAAFESCTSLTAINVTAGNPNYASVDGVLYNRAITTLIEYPAGVIGAFTIPNSVTSIGDFAFADCTSLTSVVIPNSVMCIGNYTFFECRSLTSVTIGGSVTSIGNEAFGSCYGLTSVTIGSGVTSMGYAAFSYCTSLTSVTIGSGVTTIGDSAFSYCTSLISVTIPNSVTTIGYAAFESCYDLTSVTIPDSVTSIEQEAFESCTSLTSVNIPNSVTSIGHGAFESCVALTSVIIPNSVTSISEYVFYSCTSLTSVTIPSSITYIGDYAFYRCTSLASIAFLGLVAPTTVGANWTLGTDAGIRGHAYASSNFPAPGSNFYGLTMGAVIPIPGVPTNLSVTAGNARVVLTWTAPVDNGYLVITNYSVYRSTSENGTFALIASPSGLSYTDTGLASGQTYWYKVSAVNGAGEGAQSPVVSVLVPKSANPASDSTILILVAVIAIAVVLVAALFVMPKRKGEK